MIFAKEAEDLFVITIQGLLTFQDLTEVQNRARAEMDPQQKVNILILAQQFAGWGKGGDWGDVSFMYEVDPSLEKIAIVATQKWRDEIMMFVGADRRQAVVKFFLDDQERDARSWLKDQTT